MKELAKKIIKKNRLVIVLFTLVTLIFGIFLRDLKINPDVLSYFPKNDPDVQLFNYLGEEYGGNSLAMIVLETGDIFTTETLTVIDELTTRFQLEPGVAYVTSLTNTLDIKTDEYGFEIGRLVDVTNLPRDPDALAALKEYTLSKEMFRNNLVTEDATATLVICRLQTNTDQVATCRRLKEIVAETVPAMKIYYGGIPFMILDLHNMITDDLQILIPMVSIVIVLFLYLGFRKWEGVFLPLISVAVSLVWTLGIMSLLKVPLSIISNIIPVILIAVGNAYTIHVLSRFNEARIARTRDCLATALYEVATPVSLAGITTIAGFISFIFGSYLVMIQEFGVFAALGILFTLLVSLAFIPALLVLEKKEPDQKAKKEERRKRSALTGRITRGIEKLVTKRPKAIVWVGVFLAILALTGIPRISRRVNLVEYFQPQAPIRQAETILEEKFGGSGIIQILAEGDIQDPAVLREMEKLEEFLLAQEGIHSTQSVVNLLKELNHAMGEEKNLPDTKDKVMNLWFLLEGEEVMTQLVNAGRTEAVIQARIVGSLEGSRAHKLVRTINEYTAGIDPELVKFSQTGMPVIYRNLDLSILKSQFQSLFIALLMIFLIMLFLLGSLAGGLLGLVPILFTLVLIFGFMGYGKIPLDIATVLVASVTIGIGIDYSIHFLSRYRQELARASAEKRPVEIAVRTTLNTTGGAILINVFTVAFGFLSLVFCQLVPIQRFGILIFVTMLGSGFGAILLLPAILLLYGARLNLRPVAGREKGKKTELEIRKGERRMKRSLFYFGLLLILPGLLFSAAAAGSLTAEEIMERIDQTVSAPRDQELHVKLVITDAKGNESHREMVMMQKGSDRRVVKFTAPPEQRGIAFLSLPGGMTYLYLPAYKQTRRIAAHVRNQKFAGTDFSYEDMEARKYSTDWNAKLLAEEEGLYRLELTPKEKTVTDYGRLIVEVKADIFFPVTIEFFDKANRPRKVMIQEKLEQINGYWIAREAEMKDLQAGTSSKMFFTEVKFDSGLPDDIFTERYLSR